jgi:hypothetical protein
VQVAGCSKVPYSKYPDWEYHFTGVPEYLNLSKFASFKKEEFLLLAICLNNGEIELKRQE